MAIKEPEFKGFEVLGSHYDQRTDMVALLKQVVSEKLKDNPSVGFIVKVQGSQMFVCCTSIETYLTDPTRLRIAEENADTYHSDFLKAVKKEYKSRGKRALAAKEQKELRDRDVQRVSLNERFYLITRRVYELTGE